MNDTDELLPHVKLRFNIDHPSVEECYAHGYEAAHLDIMEEENPFREGTIEHEHWMEGWWAGFYGEKPLFEIADSNDLSLKTDHDAANDKSYHVLDQLMSSSFFATMLRITGAIAATAVVGYQVLELVA